MKADQIGLYVHIPFCVKKCNYCDFCSFANIDIETRAKYINSLCREIKGYNGKSIRIDSLFFGGGTPTLLSVEEFKKIVDAIRTTFVMSDNLEFSMEANPGTVVHEKLLEFIKLGVNRFSIGLQSIHENELKILGRIHTYDDFLKTYNDMRELGITNINVDLMYGLPEQNIDSFHETLKMVTSLSPEHISVYGLILEDGTPFFRMKDSLNLPSEDEECNMYYSASEHLKANGYNHYEISNYSKPGYESRHNLKYWKNKEYIGVGASAYSYLDGRRYGNTDDMSKYIEGTEIISYDESIDINTEKYEYVMLALRLREGFSLNEYKNKFAEDFLIGREETVSKLINGGYISLSDGRISLTESGFYISNYILTELL
jgi:oxygen-independent coproporphyrinogen-3 oxidase